MGGGFILNYLVMKYPTPFVSVLLATSSHFLFNRCINYCFCYFGGFLDGYIYATWLCYLASSAPRKLSATPSAVVRRA